MLDRVDRTEPVLFVEEVRKSKYRGLNPSFHKKAQRNNKLRAEQKAREEEARRTEEEKTRLEEQKIALLQKQAERRFRDMIARLKRGDDDNAELMVKQPVREIIAAVSVDTGVPVADILGPRRTKHIVEARFQAIAEARKRRPDLSLPQLGRAFNRDHTSILSALRKMQCDKAAS